MSQSYRMPAGWSLMWIAERFAKFYARQKFYGERFIAPTAMAFFLQSRYPLLCFDPYLTQELIAQDAKEVGNLAVSIKRFWERELKSERGRARVAVSEYMANRLQTEERVGINGQTATVRLELFEYPAEIDWEESIPDAQDIHEFAEQLGIGSFPNEKINAALAEMREWYSHHEAWCRSEIEHNRGLLAELMGDS